MDWVVKLKGLSELSFWYSDMPQRNRNDIPDLLRAMPVKVSVSWRDLVRLGLLMRQMALDWTLSRRQRVDLIDL